MWWEVFARYDMSAPAGVHLVASVPGRHGGSGGGDGGSSSLYGSGSGSDGDGGGGGGDGRGGGGGSIRGSRSGGWCVIDGGSDGDGRLHKYGHMRLRSLLRRHVARTSDIVCCQVSSVGALTRPFLRDFYDSVTACGDNKAGVGGGGDRSSAALHNAVGSARCCTAGADRGQWMVHSANTAGGGGVQFTARCDSASSGDSLTNAERGESAARSDRMRPAEGLSKKPEQVSIGKPAQATNSNGIPAQKSIEKPAWPAHEGPAQPLRGAPTPAINTVTPARPRLQLIWPTEDDVLSNPGLGGTYSVVLGRRNIPRLPRSLLHRLVIPDPARCHTLCHSKVMVGLSLGGSGGGADGPGGVGLRDAGSDGPVGVDVRGPEGAGPVGATPGERVVGLPPRRRAPGCCWVLAGSHNLSKAAWGSLVRDYSRGGGQGQPWQRGGRGGDGGGVAGGDGAMGRGWGRGGSGSTLVGGSAAGGRGKGGGAMALHILSYELSVLIVRPSEAGPTFSPSPPLALGRSRREAGPEVARDDMSTTGAYSHGDKFGGMDGDMDGGMDGDHVTCFWDRGDRPAGPTRGAVADVAVAALTTTADISAAPDAHGLCHDHRPTGDHRPAPIDHQPCKIMSLGHTGEVTTPVQSSEGGERNGGDWWPCRLPFLAPAPPYADWDVPWSLERAFDLAYGTDPVSMATPDVTAMALRDMRAVGGHLGMHPPGSCGCATSGHPVPDESAAHARYDVHCGHVVDGSQSRGDITKGSKSGVDDAMAADASFSMAGALEASKAALLALLGAGGQEGMAAGVGGGGAVGGSCPAEGRGGSGGDGGGLGGWDSGRDAAVMWQDFIRCVPLGALGPLVRGRDGAASCPGDHPSGDRDSHRQVDDNDNGGDHEMGVDAAAAAAGGGGGGLGDVGIAGDVADASAGAPSAGAGVAGSSLGTGVGCRGAALLIFIDSGAATAAATAAAAEEALRAAEGEHRAGRDEALKAAELGERNLRAPETEQARELRDDTVRTASNEGDLLRGDLAWKGEGAWGVERGLLTAGGGSGSTQAAARTPGVAAIFTGTVTGSGSVHDVAAIDSERHGGAGGLGNAGINSAGEHCAAGMDNSLSAAGQTYPCPGDYGLGGMEVPGNQAGEEAWRDATRRHLALANLLADPNVLAAARAAADCAWVCDLDIVRQYKKWQTQQFAGKCRAQQHAAQGRRVQHRMESTHGDHHLVPDRGRTSSGAHHLLPDNIVVTDDGRCGSPLEPHGSPATDPQVRKPTPLRALPCEAVEPASVDHLGAVHLQAAAFFKRVSTPRDVPALHLQLLHPSAPVEGPGPRLLQGAADDGAAAAGVEQGPGAGHVGSGGGLGGGNLGTFAVGSNMPRCEGPGIPGQNVGTNSGDNHDHEGGSSTTGIAAHDTGNDSQGRSTWTTRDGDSIEDAVSCHGGCLMRVTGDGIEFLDAETLGDRLRSARDALVSLTVAAQTDAGGEGAFPFGEGEPPLVAASRALRSNAAGEEGASSGTRVPPDGDSASASCGRGYSAVVLDGGPSVGDANMRPVNSPLASSNPRQPPVEQPRTTGGAGARGPIHSGGGSLQQHVLLPDAAAATDEVTAGRRPGEGISGILSIPGNPSNAGILGISGVSAAAFPAAGARNWNTSGPSFHSPPTLRPPPLLRDPDAAIRANGAALSSRWSLIIFDMDGTLSDMRRYRLMDGVATLLAALAPDTRVAVATNHGGPATLQLWIDSFGGGGGGRGGGDGGGGGGGGGHGGGRGVGRGGFVSGGGFSSRCSGGDICGGGQSKGTPTSKGTLTMDYFVGSRAGDGSEKTDVRRGVSGSALLISSRDNSSEGAPGFADDFTGEADGEVSASKKNDCQEEKIVCAAKDDTVRSGHDGGVANANHAGIVGNPGITGTSSNDADHPGFAGKSGSASKSASIERSASAGNIGDSYYPGFADNVGKVGNSGTRDQGSPGRYFSVSDAMRHVDTVVAQVRAVLRDPDRQLPARCVYVSFAYKSKSSGRWAPTPPAWRREGVPERCWQHGWRKPEGGMLVAAMRDHGGVARERTLMVGDSEDDRGAAARAGVAFLDIRHVLRMSYRDWRPC
eukprot:jgi/Mesvir1/24404/Mv11072-RA.1